MKQKYLIVKDDKNANIVISEFAELASNDFSLLSEQTYKIAAISKARKAGNDQLIKALRSTNFFPPVISIERIVAAIEELMREADKNSVEVVVDDVRVMSELEVEVDEIDDAADIEELDEILTDEDDELPEEEEE